jgi:hypothetical protein
MKHLLATAAVLVSVVPASARFWADWECGEVLVHVERNRTTKPETTDFDITAMPSPKLRRRIGTGVVVTDIRLEQILDKGELTMYLNGRRCKELPEDFDVSKSKWNKTEPPISDD